MNQPKLDLSQTQTEEKLNTLMTALDSLNAQESIEISDIGGLLSLLPQLPPSYQQNLKAYAIFGSEQDQKLKLMRTLEKDGGCCGSCTCGD